MFIRVLLVVSVCCVVYQSVAQSIGVGPRVVRIKHNAVNNIIDHYNETRPWLKNQLENQNFIPGIAFKGEINLLDSDKFFMNFSFAYGRNVSTAKGTTPAGVSFKRQLKSRIVDANLLGATFYPLNRENLKFGFGVTAMNATWYNVFSKIDTDDEGWVNYTSSPEYLSSDASSFISRGWLSSGAEVNLKMNLFDLCWMTISLHTIKHYLNPSLDLLDLSVALNPNTYALKIYDKRTIVDNWGLSIYFGPKDRY